MRDHLFVGLLAAAFLVLNAWLGRGWIDAIGGAVAVAVFGEVAGWYIHRPRRPSRGRRSPRRTKAQRAEQPAGARRRERQDWVAEVGTGVGVIALGLALLSLPPSVAHFGNPTWLGFGLVLLGLGVCLLSTATFLWDRTHRL